jgi:hypothetical protein
VVVDDENGGWHAGRLYRQGPAPQEPRTKVRQGSGETSP